jgi:hypothetical protein
LPASGNSEYNQINDLPYTRFWESRQGKVFQYSGFLHGFTLSFYFKAYSDTETGSGRWGNEFIVTILL